MKKMLESFVASTFLLCAASPGCTVEDASGGEMNRQEARELAEVALDDYLACQAAESNECASERDELEAAIDELDVAAGDLVFRAGAVADCGGGQAVGCNGDSCMATDNVGCACTSGGKLSSVAACAQK